MMTSYIVEIGNLKLVKLNIGYQPSKLQSLGCLDRIFWRLVLDTKKHHYDVIMTSFLTAEFLN